MRTTSARHPSWPLVVLAIPPVIVNLAWMISGEHASILWTVLSAVALLRLMVLAGAGLLRWRRAIVAHRHQELDRRLIRLLNRIDLQTYAERLDPPEAP